MYAIFVWIVFGTEKVDYVMHPALAGTKRSIHFIAKTIE